MDSDEQSWQRRFEKLDKENQLLTERLLNLARTKNDVLFSEVLIKHLSQYAKRAKREKDLDLLKTIRLK